MAAVVRNPSKPSAIKLAERGVAVIKGDLLNITTERLQKILAGADTVIASVNFSCIEAQREIVDAAKAVGVKRVVPDDFGTDAPAGVMFLHDKVGRSRHWLLTF